MRYRRHRLTQDYEQAVSTVQLEVIKGNKRQVLHNKFSRIFDLIIGLLEVIILKFD